MSKMVITEKKVSIEKLIDGFHESDERGVWCYDGGLLNIRPAYQREFIYNDEQKVAVMETILRGYPLGIFYWVENDDGTFEVLDGQQRIMSILRYIESDEFSVDRDDNPFFYSTWKEQHPEICNEIKAYELEVKFCKGGDFDEKLKWFEVINTHGEELKPQELRNAIYSGPWVTDAKRNFSKQNGGAVVRGKKYVNAGIERQGFLETGIKWIAGNSVDEIKKYMAKNREEKDADEMLNYFLNVIDWVQKTFPDYYEEMEKIDWGRLYREHGNRNNLGDLKNRVEGLMEDEDIDVKRGIFEYLLTGRKRHLNLRAFNSNERRTIWQRQKGICPECNKGYSLKEMDADHIKAWSEGGATRLENAQMLCKECNQEKGAK